MKIGILGAGQLGTMLALAGYPLGLRFRFFDPDPDAPGHRLAEHIIGAYDDAVSLRQFASGLDAVTYEFENIPLALARALDASVPVYPSPRALDASQDRLLEKQLFERIGMATAPYRAVHTRADLDGAIREIGRPAVLKTRRFGYDGKGQAVIRTAGDADTAWGPLGGVPCILEGFVSFDREVSQLAVRGRAGEAAFYPLVENHHAGGILRVTYAPAPGVSPALQEQAVDLTRLLLDALDYVGVLAVEFFEKGGKLVANEFAPRVHNSGHWSIEGSVTSQFENHLRAVAGWPLGSTAQRQPCAMINIIGELPEVGPLLALADAHLHLYGKAPRPGRKLGHVTICDKSGDRVRERVATLLQQL
jgi:5-(carboxyamino)imidazole ribonucleotide synthase